MAFLHGGHGGRGDGVMVQDAPYDVVLLDIWLPDREEVAAWGRFTRCRRIHGRRW